VAPVELDLMRLGKAVITFGRAADNDVVLTSPYVSRHHGRLRYADGAWVIEDLGSSNGMIYQGKAIRARLLLDGDAVRIDDGVETTAQGVLLVFSGAGRASEWESLELAGRGEITIGRDASCDIPLDHVSVSRVHARILSTGGEWHLIDNHSTNGVVVNGKRVTGRYRLHEKDVILITNSQLIFGSERLTWHMSRGGIRVDATGIVKRVDGNRRTICNDVSFTVEPCELVAIIGGSGAGKTTVMNCISGYSPPTSGEVQVNGLDLYESFDALKNLIGYVPQQDIVFDNLTVASMLWYAAKLRLPADTSERERREAIDRVMRAVDLAGRKDTLIKRLSGGQKKRASIAVELLSDPNLFFLDEPASGLDPGTERSLMKTLRQMASGGKTVIFVTHSTLNLHLCDKIVFMGTGGNLCYCGSYAEALEFFGIEDIVDVYSLITESSEAYRAKFAAGRGDLPRRKPKGNKAGIPPGVAGTPALPPLPAVSPTAPKQRARSGTARQTMILLRRNLHILINDRVRLLMLLAQAPLLAALISLVADSEQFEQYEMTKSLLFAVACSAFWVGILNSIQEVCKERTVLRREYMTGLRLNAYIIAKAIAMGLVCAVQSLLLVAVFASLVGMPGEGVLGGSPFAEFLLVTFLTALAASAIGIFVSSLFRNADRAMTVAPLLLMPQLLFSGLIFKLEGATEAISWVATCRFSMEGYGTLADLNSLTMRLAQEGVPVEHVAEDFYEFSGGHFLFALIVLMAYVPVFCACAMFVLRGIRNEQT
jgi:ABC-type multidrug transport system ATPase subunit/pSer/pThr/pTyr-binding forkhead associated (FHA) protein/ABC-type multidrug transport system permease subunit